MHQTIATISTFAIARRNHSQGQKRYPKELLRQRFRWTSGELSGAICLKNLALLGTDRKPPRIVQKVFGCCSCDIFWLWGSFWAPDIGSSCRAARKRVFNRSNQSQSLAMLQSQEGIATYFSRKMLAIAQGNIDIRNPQQSQSQKNACSRCTQVATPTLQWPRSWSILYFQHLPLQAQKQTGYSPQSPFFVALFRTSHQILTLCLYPLKLRERFSDMYRERLSQVNAGFHLLKVGHDLCTGLMLWVPFSFKPIPLTNNLSSGCGFQSLIATPPSMRWRFQCGLVACRVSGWSFWLSFSSEQ